MFNTAALALTCALTIHGARDGDDSSAEMSFFVTSRGVDGSASLGGLTGADRHCAKLAAAAGAGDKVWRAYLSAAAEKNQPVVNARDRIGLGPWKNAKGVVIAEDLDELHSDNNKLTRFTALTERGETVPGDSHDILTGSDEGGRLAFVGDTAATCANWTGKQDGVAKIGHHDRFDADSWGNKRFPRWHGSWNSEHRTIGCDVKRLAETGGGGRFYCFAAGEQYSFKRGLNINHWLADNLAADVWPNSLYGADWFDEEDVAWIAEHGFDHLRIRVGGDQWINKDGDLDEAKVAPFDRALVWAKKHRLGVVLTMFSTPGFRTGVRGGEEPTDVSSPFTDEATLGDAAYLWWLVARRYAGEGDNLRFELLHAPKDASVEQVQTYNKTVLTAVRRTNPTRVVYLTSHDMTIDTVDEVDRTDSHVAIAVDFWEPEAFTFQVDEKIPLIKFPAGEHTVATVETRIAKLGAWARREAPGREIYVAGFGVYLTADDISARNYIRAARAAFERQGLAWAIYDYHTGCAVRGKDGAPTRILDGLSLRAL